MRHLILATTALAALFMISPNAQADLMLRFSPGVTALTGTGVGEYARAETTGQSAPNTIHGSLSGQTQIQLANGDNFWTASDPNGRLLIGFPADKVPLALVGHIYINDVANAKVRWMYATQDIHAALAAGKIKTPADFKPYVARNEEAMQYFRLLGKAAGAKK